MFSFSDLGPLGNLQQRGLLASVVLVLWVAGFAAAVVAALEVVLLADRLAPFVAP